MFTLSAITNLFKTHIMADFSIWFNADAGHSGGIVLWIKSKGLSLLTHSALIIHHTEYETTGLKINMSFIARGEPIGHSVRTRV